MYQQRRFLSVGITFKLTANCYPDHTAIIYWNIDKDKMEQATYKTLNNRVNRLANALQNLGVGKEDKVAIFFHNEPRFIESYLASLKIGAVAVPINVRLSAREITYEVDFADCKALIYSEDLAGVVEEIRPNLPKVKTWICRGEKIPENTFSYEELLTRSSEEEPNVQVHLDDDCVIYFTAGTTGLPKGAVRTHEAELWHCITNALRFGFNPEAVVGGIPPFFHIAGLGSFAMAGLTAGSTLVFLNRFDPRRVMEAIEKFRITHIFLVPAMTIAIQNLPDVDKYDASSLKVYMSASAPLLTEQKKWILKRFPNVKLWEGYGITEGGDVAYIPPEYIVRKDMCVGKPDFSKEVKIVNEEGKEVVPGEFGEVLVRGPGVFSGYYKDPEKTRESFTPDGFFRTGDVGKYDEEGFIYLVDRIKDMVITGGENVYAAEVENILATHPAVRECAMFGVPDPKWGEAVVAAVVLKQGQKATEEELIEYCRQNLAHYKCPKNIVFMDALPRNPFGKVLKRELRERFKDLRTKTSS